MMTLFYFWLNYPFKPSLALLLYKKLLRVEKLL